MKIVSWNCGGKFREKFKYISELEADIYIIQECENPTEYKNTPYFGFTGENFYWIGDKNTKGLGVFAKTNIELKLNDWNSYCLRNFLSVRVNDKFNVLAVWACKPYIEEYYIYQSINMDNFNGNTVIIGDFNSNAIWDKKGDTRTHGSVVDQLEKIGLCSAYHYTTGEEQGKETKNTFYLYRHTDRGYHIDHCFVSPNLIRSYCILDANMWLDKSDHVPIVLEYSL